MNRNSRRIEERPRLSALTLAVIAAHPKQSVMTFMGVSAACVIISNALFLQAGQHPAPLFVAKPKTAVAQPEPVALPRPRIVEMSLPAPVAVPAVPRGRAEVITDLQRDLSRKGFYDGAVDGIWGARTDTALRDFLQAAGLRMMPEANEEVLRAVTQSNFSKSSRGAEPAVSAGNRNDPIGDILTGPPREVPAAQPAPVVQPVAVAQPSSGSKRLVAVQRALADFGYGQVKATGTMGPETKEAIERFERDRKLPVTGQLSDRLVRDLAAVTGRPLD